MRRTHFTFHPPFHRSPSFPLIPSFSLPSFPSYFSSRPRLRSNASAGQDRTEQGWAGRLSCASEETIDFTLIYIMLHAMPCSCLCPYLYLQCNVTGCLTIAHLLPCIVRQSTLLSAIHSVTTLLYPMNQPTMILHSAIDMS